MNRLKYVSPKTKAEALRILSEEGPGAKVVAGCTNVLPDLRAQKYSPQLLVDISGIRELASIAGDGSGVTLGSLVTIDDLITSEVIGAHAGLLRQAAAVFADPHVRRRATLGGNLANASPAADSAVPLLALGAVLKVESSAGERLVDLSDFFLGPHRNALRPDEIITGVRFESDANHKKNFIKFGLRKAMAISLVTVAVSLQVSENRIVRAGAAFGAVAPTPVRARRVEAFLTGKLVSPDLLDEATAMVAGEVSPITDIRSSAGYRGHLSGILFRRATEAALAN